MVIVLAVGMREHHKYNTERAWACRACKVRTPGTRPTYHVAHELLPDFLHVAPYELLLDTEGGKSDIRSFEKQREWHTAASNQNDSAAVRLILRWEHTGPCRARPYPIHGIHHRLTWWSASRDTGKEWTNLPSAACALALWWPTDSGCIDAHAPIEPVHHRQGTATVKRQSSAGGTFAVDAMSVELNPHR